MMDVNDLVVVMEDHTDYNPEGFLLEDRYQVRAMLRELKADFKGDTVDAEGFHLRVWLDRHEGNKIELQSKYKGNDLRDDLVRRISLLHLRRVQNADK